MSNFGGVSMHFYKIGKLVYMVYAGNLNLSSANSFIALGTIPTGFLPLVETCISYVQINAGVKGVGRISFYDDGNIKVYSQLSGLYEAKCSTCWVTS